MNKELPYTLKIFLLTIFFYFSWATLWEQTRYIIGGGGDWIRAMFYGPTSPYLDHWVYLIPSFIVSLLIMHFIPKAVRGIVWFLVIFDIIIILSSYA